ncbi:MAG: acetolactate synthase small subunit [Lachnospiraceae bacterium]|nr:acetolactate synthase small subunit [Lachnospiraceae bacterium]MBR4208657.1 acetolactate synthase small subunit [Lachnospiraceae bacterium]
MQRIYISALVDNHEGVLARISSLFTQRGFNIETIAASETSIPAITRITISTEGDEEIMNQMMKQTQKLEEVRAVFALEPSSSLMRELLLVKLEADETNRSYLREICEIYRAKIVDLSLDSMIIELTGEPKKLDAFLKVLKPYTIIEMCRSGVTALERGKMSYVLE